MNLFSTLLTSKARLRRRRTSTRCWKQRGIAAIEFALTLPLWITILLGGTDCAFWVIVNEKTDRIAYSVTDIVSQYQTVSIANLNDILLAASQLMQPFSFGNKGIVIISSVYKPNGQSPTVKWQYAGGGSLAQGSAIGSTGGNASLPNGLTLNDNDNVIISEVYYKFTPMFFNSTHLFPTNNIYRVAMYKPRLSPLITPPT